MTDCFMHYVITHIVMWNNYTSRETTNHYEGGEMWDDYRLFKTSFHVEDCVKKCEVVSTFFLT